MITIPTCDLHDCVVANTMSSNRSESKIGWRVEHFGRQIHVVDVRWPTLTGAELWLLLRSDAHHDSKHCRRDMELRHLQQAVERNALVCDLGDTLDLMQGRSDNRSSKSSLRPGLVASTYFDRVIQEASEFYTQKHKGVQLANQFVVVGQGNHESAWLKHHESCPTTHLVRSIKGLAPASQVGAGAYGGYIHLKIRCNSTVRSFTIRYAHGASNGGIMTMGALDINRMTSWIPDADMIAIGHTHDSMIVPRVRERFRTQNGKFAIEYGETMFVRCGTYKDEFFGTEGMGWAVERGGGPKPLGAKWVRLYPVYEWSVGGADGGKCRGRGIWRIACDVIEAK